MSHTRYQGFDVMDEAPAWDRHTRSIVQRRLEPFKGTRHLDRHESETLRTIAAHLLYEERASVLNHVVSHFDGAVGEVFGESERKANVPPEAQLIRDGLSGIDAVAQKRYGTPFKACGVKEQFRILADLQKGRVEQIPDMRLIPQKALFKKLLSLAVEAYASHPTVWSEMGYAGPAYPRGYYRIERGLRDPWEPEAVSGRIPKPGVEDIQDRESDLTRRARTDGKSKD